ncbi:ABC transporter-like protein [Amylocarpus encephaloides]|uniref:ABC transporter-like protein n=1 Tax=Amylocarpus encephaloides TaxID=45428 RepID=A0A9P8C591_9HELO|nr:ABC transporter-like protein [Amylocarpus encephaloides]
MAQLILQGFDDPWHGRNEAYRTFKHHQDSFEGETRGHCSRAWDSVNAQFEPCFLPHIAAIPAAVAICIVLGYLIRLIPGLSIRPRWLDTFIDEVHDQDDDLAPKQKRRLTLRSSMLLAATCIGFFMQLPTIFYPEIQFGLIWPMASWAIAAVLVVILRPLTTPKALLFLYISIFISQFIILVNGKTSIEDYDAPAILVLFWAFAAILIILQMPLRDPSLPKFTISPTFGPPTSQLRTPEDNLTLWQFMSVSWMAPLIALGNARQLNDDDVWGLGYQFQHRTLHDRFREMKGTVLRRLVDANGLDLFIITMLVSIPSYAMLLVKLFLDLSAPIFLQKILQSMEDHRSPRRAAVTYAIISLIIRLIASQSGVFSIWYQRRAYERSRGELVTMLYEKTLSRKMVSVSSKVQNEGNASGNENGVAKSKEMSKWKTISGYIRKPFQSKKVATEVPPETNEEAPKESLELASTGKIINLMRFDAYEIAQRFWEFPQLITQPLRLILSVILIWILIGWPCLIGVITVFVAQGFNAMIARVLLTWERTRRVATDKKIHKVSQLVEAIRHLRYYGWQDVWLGGIMEARQRELNLQIITGLWRLLIRFITSFSSGMFPVVAFYAYTALANKPLKLEVAFPALQLFAMLESSLRQLPDLITILLNARVSMGRIEEFMSEPDMEEAELAQASDGNLEMQNASFSWPGASAAVLHEISLSFSPGLTVIYGEVGAGKTALLQSILGELDKLDGEYERSNEMVGYCAQTPWLQSMSIRENILFSAPYDEVRYRRVMDVCALIPDMASFKHGDLSLVGENGVGLSGGQKSRLSLARAVYSQAKVLLLDDPLSALDHQTADSIVRRCFSGPLMKDRTVILVTHRTELCIHIADQIVQIADGRAEVIDREIVSSDELCKIASHDGAHDDPHIDEEQHAAAIPDKFLEDEQRAHGGVKFSIYWEYIKAGMLRWWFMLILALVLYRVVDIGETWFLKAWGEAYGEIEQTTKIDNPLSGLPSPEDNIKPWLVGFLVLAAAQSLAFVMSQSVMLVIVYQAGKNMFREIMTRVGHATFRFYDITPVGRLMNRLTSDINTIDGNISDQFQFFAILAISWVSSIVIFASVTPYFLVFAIGLTLTFVWIFMHFLPTSQSLRRLEMVSLSPLISNFGELATGLTSIRAFKVSHLFQARVITVTDKFQGMDHFYWSLQAWLMYRFDTLSAVSTFLLTALALFTGVSPGLTAFVLTAAGKFVLCTHMLCKVYGQLQMDFVSVERVVELLHLEQEPPGTIEPPAYWPSLNGDIVFENVTIKYAPHLDPALIDVSLKIKGGSTTALIGRTGSGKSTLALSLLATTLPTSGRILIDGIDISKISTQALRKRITFLAQEPVLFPGSMRANLDPLSEYTDEDCTSVLFKIAGRHNWTLDTHIDTGGRNLSQGQRQLVGLARALLRRSAIVVMDEATASIDSETAGRIQEVLRGELGGSTVVVIAHRVEAVRGASDCVVLKKGKVERTGAVGGENVREMME